MYYTYVWWKEYVYAISLWSDTSSCLCLISFKKMERKKTNKEIAIRIIFLNSRARFIHECSFEDYELVSNTQLRYISSIIIFFDCFFFFVQSIDYDAMLNDYKIEMTKPTIVRICSKRISEWANGREKEIKKCEEEEKSLTVFKSSGRLLNKRHMCRRFIVKKIVTCAKSTVWIRFSTMRHIK